jgi:hypothetical protein
MMHEDRRVKPLPERLCVLDIWFAGNAFHAQWLVFSPNALTINNATAAARGGARAGALNGIKP